MTERLLDSLLVTLDVAVEAFAICEIGPDTRLVFEAMDAVVVHYVLTGTLHLTSDGGAPAAYPAGSVIIVPPRLGQMLAAHPTQPLRREIAATEHCAMERGGMLLFDAADGATGALRVVCGTIMASLSGSFGLVDRMRRPIAAELGDIVLVRDAFRAMVEEINQPGIGSRAMTGALMKVCLVQLIRRVAALDGTGGAMFGALQDPRLGRTIAAVLDAPGAGHTVASLAGIAGMSRSAFAREFSASFAMTPIEFVGKTRLHHAADLLRSTTLPVKAIAASIGFSSRSHFSRAFRDAYGADPTKFRRTSAQPLLDAPAPLKGSRERFALAAEPEGGE